MSNFRTLQLSDELLAHPERWIEAREQQPQPKPQPQQLHHLRRAAPTSIATGRTLTLPASLASEASLRNRNRNRIRDQLRVHNPDCIRDEHRDLVRGSPQSRVPVPVQARDPIRHLQRDQIQIQPHTQTQDRSQSRLQSLSQALPQQQKHAALAMYAPTIATAPPPPPPPPLSSPAPIDIGIDSATSALSIDTDTSFAFSLNPPSPPFKPPPPFRGTRRGSTGASAQSQPQSPRPPHPNCHNPEEDELHALAVAAWERADRRKAGEIFNDEELQTLADEMREWANRRDGRGVSRGWCPPFVPFVPSPPVGPKMKRRTVDTGKTDTSGVYTTDHGPRIALEALRRKMPVGWTSPRRDQRGEEVELPGRTPRGGWGGAAGCVEELGINTDARAAMGGTGLETETETAAENGDADADAEWVLVPAAPATTTEDAEAEEAEIEIEIEAENGTEWCLVTT